MSQEGNLFDKKLLYMSTITVEKNNSEWRREHFGPKLSYKTIPIALKGPKFRKIIFNRFKGVLLYCCIWVMQAFRSDANNSRDASYNRHVSNSMDAMSVGTPNKQKVVSNNNSKRRKTVNSKDKSWTSRPLTAAKATAGLTAVAKAIQRSRTSQQ